ncbi:hypothetical protein CEXT_447611 [Caerostris extrusa]|uniref:Uncharacterized protein n=1 Tax=Caerostris extrusa TaxID=172846 RepID=A0AAV4VMK1_CAEEX|nr:hypothetical protein CEXT_447611 [Caerostris extrusa]
MSSDFERNPNYGEHFDIWTRTARLSQRIHLSTPEIPSPPFLVSDPSKIPPFPIVNKVKSVTASVFIRPKPTAPSGRGGRKAGRDRVLPGEESFAWVDYSLTRKITSFYRNAEEGYWLFGARRALSVGDKF